MCAQIQLNFGYVLQMNDSDTDVEAAQLEQTQMARNQRKRKVANAPKKTPNRKVRFLLVVP